MHASRAAHACMISNLTVHVVLPIQRCMLRRAILVVIHSTPADAAGALQHQLRLLGRGGETQMANRGLDRDQNRRLTSLEIAESKDAEAVGLAIGRQLAEDEDLFLIAGAIDDGLEGGAPRRMRVSTMLAQMLKRAVADAEARGVDPWAYVRMLLGPNGAGLLRLIQNH